MDANTLMPGKYVVAVSGGVDSVVLLDLLTKEPEIELIIAHVDHGIREDSSKDADFVKSLANKYKLPFESTKLNLGKNASEELARKERYKILKKVQQKHHALAIITAHHQDDVIETAFINIVRGTGSRGLSSLKSTQDVIRPLTGVTKRQIQQYANKHKLKWKEDSTNKDTTILRNKIRHNVVPKMNERLRGDALAMLNAAKDTNAKLDKELDKLLHKGLHKGQPVLSRGWFCKLPHDISTEVIRLLLQKYGGDIDRKTIERVTINIKTLPAGKIIQANGVEILLTKRSARFKKTVVKQRKR